MQTERKIIMLFIFLKWHHDKSEVWYRKTNPSAKQTKLKIANKSSTCDSRDSETYQHTGKLHPMRVAYTLTHSNCNLMKLLMLHKLKP